MKKGIILFSISELFLICSKEVFFILLQSIEISLLTSFIAQANPEGNELKYFAIPINRSLSLICKQVPKINLTLLPTLLVLFSIETLNEESPVANLVYQ